MNTRCSTLAIAALAAVLMLDAVLTITGCRHSTPDRVAYDSAQAATITVEAAMKLWDGYLAAHHPGPAVETKVKAAYDRYRQADIALLKAGQNMILFASVKTQDPAFADSTEKWHKAQIDLVAAVTDLFSTLKANGLKLP